MGNGSLTPLLTIFHLNIVAVNFIGWRTWWGVLDTTLGDKLCQWLAAGLWFYSGTPVSSSNKTDSYDITEILLKVAP